MEVILFVLYILGLLYLFVWFIKAIIRSATNLPTWSGIIISAFLGILPLYLILCYFGIMGEKRNESLNNTGTYAEKMHKQYAYDSSQKNTGWLKYAVLVFVVMFTFYLLSDDSNEQEVITPTEIIATEKILDDQIEEKTTVVKQKTSVHKQKIKQKSSTSEKTPTLVTKKQKSTLELLKEENHASVVKQAEEAGVSTVGTTLEILERINRKMMEEF